MPAFDLKRTHAMAADHGNRVRSCDSKCLKGLVLRNLRNLELEGTLAVDHYAAVVLEPSQDSCGELGCVAMPPRVGGRTHAIVEDTLRRFHRQIQHAFIEEPLAERHFEHGELTAQRLDPRAILMDHEDTRRSCAREALRFHRALGSGSDKCDTALNIRANATNKKTWNLGARTSLRQEVGCANR